MQSRIPIIALLSILLIFSSGIIRAQEQLVMIDTSDYLPLPDGLNINLSIAASKGYTYEVHRLIKKGANPDEQDNIGATPLVYAVANNQLNCVNALLSYEVEIDFLTDEGESPLHIATKYGLIEIAEKLIRSGADVNLQDYYGCSPIHYSAAYNDIYFTDLLLYYNARLESRSDDGTTPLIAAVWTGDAEITDLLIQAGSDANGADFNGFTPLLVAAQNGDTLIADLVLKNGADLYFTNRYGYNALAISIRADQTEMTDFLLRKMSSGSSVNQKTADPFEVARSYGRKDVIELLEKYNVKRSSGIKFDQVSISSFTKFNGHDIYLGSSLAFSEPYHKFKITAGIDFKPGYTRVLLEESENNFSQYLDKRYVLYFGTGKDITLIENYLKGDLSLELNMNIGYMLCSQFIGTYITPENRMVLMPSFQIKWSKKPMNLFMGYEYMKTGLYKAGPGWIKAGLSVNIYFSKVRAPLKDIKWY